MENYLSDTYTTVTQYRREHSSEGVTATVLFDFLFLQILQQKVFLSQMNLEHVDILGHPAMQASSQKCQVTDTLDVNECVR